MAIPFLSARWSNLALITYAIEPAILDPYLPPGCEADTIDGRAFVSLVAFDFLETRVLGIPWPGFMNFPEVNLRCYVRDTKTGRRGVTFIAEFVPQRFVAWTARTLYGEPYRAVPMTSRFDRDKKSISINHSLTIDGREQIIRVAGRQPAIIPAETSVEHFFKEHEWGFGKSRDGQRRVTYRVEHERWAVYPVERHDLNFDFGHVYGERWSFLNGTQTHNVTLAAGSAVKVYPWRKE